ncbi:cell wall-binding repeat-containing protein [Georgenia sp. SYP-B2076]|uniref:cell wall-binding repeat-containing protein n=1 Tax=Georgenia sp. SYP-B2076 TaxID=2495881 RepID=UPI000F8F11C7|nr:cell wall-binding repeat-containing protein [Georgenia sp. SYP-B2076]
MGKTTRRGSLALAAAVAVVLSSSTIASAAIVDSPDAPKKASVERLSGDNRILTAIAASNEYYETDDVIAPTPEAVTAATDKVQAAYDASNNLAGAPLTAAVKVITDEADGTTTNKTAAEFLEAYGVTEVQYLALSAADKDALAQRVYDEATDLAANDPLIVAAVAGVPNRDGTTANNVIIARSDDFADALTATPLADELDAPVLINATDKLDPAVQAELNRLGQNRTGAINVTIVGGKSAISASVEKSIKGLKAVGNVERIDGQDRFETAVNIAGEISNTSGGIFLTTGMDFADALAAGTAAAKDNGVVLLTDGDKLDKHVVDGVFGPDSKSSYTGKYLDAAGYSKVVAVGGPAAAAVDTKIGPKQAAVGDDRYETAVKVAQKYFASGDPINTVTTDFVAVASGADFADAVVAAAYIANKDGVLLLTVPGSLSDATDGFLTAANKLDKSQYFDVKLFGGTTAVSASVEAELKDAVDAE